MIQGSIFAGVDADFTVIRVSENIGCIGPRARTRAGADLVFQSDFGIHTQQRTDKFGDIEEGYLSAPINKLWAQEPLFPMPPVIPDEQASMAYHPEKQRIYAGVRITGDTTVSHLFEYNMATGGWVGPWDVEARAMDYVRLGDPPLNTIMVGTSDGKVAYMDYSAKSDFDEAYTFKWKTPKLDGRSLDPSLRGMNKRWRRARVFVQPRGEWDLTLEYKTDEITRTHKADGTFKAPIAKTQNTYGLHDLDTAFVLDSSTLADSEAVGIIPFSLDVPGRWIELTLTQDNANEDISILGVELDFEPGRVLQTY
jgi:hypothetical protein